MKRTTSRPVAVDPPSEAQARASMAAYIAAHLEETKINLAANKVIEAAKKRASDSAAPFTLAKAQHETTLMAYAEAHPELFKELRKVELFGGHKIGWHTSPPAVTLVRPTNATKKQTWQGFVEACKRLAAHWLGMIRTVEEPDKEAVLEYYRQCKTRSVEEKDPTILTDGVAGLAVLGVAVTQDERFVIELNLQEAAEATAAVREAA